MNRQFMGLKQLDIKEKRQRLNTLPFSLPIQIHSVLKCLYIKVCGYEQLGQASEPAYLSYTH